MEITRLHNGWKIYSLLPVIEWKKQVNDKIRTLSKKSHKYGIEIGIIETIYLRYGRLVYELLNPVNTWGFTINSEGLAKSFDSHSGKRDSNSVLQHLIRHLSIEFTFAHYLENNTNILSNTNFHSINISYHY